MQTVTTASPPPGGSLQKIRRSRSSIIVLCALLVLMTGLLIGIGRAWSQERLDRRLVRAVTLGDSTKVDRLLSQGANARALIHFGPQPSFPTHLWNILMHRSPAPTEKGMSILMQAIYQASGDWSVANTPPKMAKPRSRKIAVALIEHGSDLEMADTCGNTPLTMAAEDDEDLALLLLAHGAKAGRTDTQQYDLQTAVLKGEHRLTAALLKSGSDPLFHKSGRSALEDAIFNADRSILREILSTYPRLDAVSPSTGLTYRALLRQQKGLAFANKEESPVP